jgi:hypothetical protein
MVHLGDGSSDIYWSIFDGSRWNKPDGTPGNEPIPGQRSSAAPALAEHNGSLHMVHLGDGSSDIYNSIYDDTNGWQANKRTYNNQSNFTPSLATLGGNLYMVHNDGSNRIQHTIRDTSLRTIVAPAGVTFGLELELSDGDIQTVALAYS